MTQSSSEALFTAAESGNLEKVRECLDAGADIHAEEDLTLRCAAKNGHLAVVRHLFEHGANIHAVNESALCCAAGDGHLGVVQYLLEKGADIHADNDLALRWAAENNNLQTVRYLMVCGADLGEAEKSEWWSKHVDKTTAEMLSSFALSLREQKELKEMSGAAPSLDIRLQNKRI